MPFNIPNIIQKFKELFKTIPKGKGDEIMLLRDWATVAVGCAVCVILGMSFGGYVFYRALSDDFFNLENAETISPKTVSRARLDKAVSNLRARQKEFQSVKITRPEAPNF